MRIPLIGGMTDTRMPSGSPETQVNLYSENNPQNAAFPISLYNTPGLTQVANLSAYGTWVRGLHVASEYAGLFCVVGQYLLQVNTGNWTVNVRGNLGSNNGRLVSMADNGGALCIVDGSNNGWYLNLQTLAFTPITDPSFSGSTRVDYVDTFFVFNSPGTPTFYTSLSNSTAFDANYWADKVGYSDILISVACPHDTVWLIGEVTCEVWYNAGGQAFPFQRMPNTVLQYGCCAPYTVIVADNAVFFLSQTRWGRVQLMRGEGYNLKRVSTFAVEERWMTYQSIGDCYAVSYADAGHQFIVLTFPTGQESWAYDVTTGFWHQRMTGNNPWPVSCMAYYNPYFLNEFGPNNWIVAGDYNNPRLYTIGRGVYTDNGIPIYRERTFPRIINDQKRVSHDQFVASMMTANPGLAPDQVSLVWSDDGGQTWGTPLVQTVNGAPNGQYSWRRLGLSRDRVYRLSWTAQGETALQGAWVEASPSVT